MCGGRAAARRAAGCAILAPALPDSRPRHSARASPKTLSQPLRILFAVTSHGLGHLTRSLAVARALREARPGLELVVASTASAERIAQDLPPPFEHRAVAYEPGVLQQSFVLIDAPATRDAYRALAAERDARLAAEARFLREAGCRAVVSDVPALPVRAASRVGVPAVAVANFTWDWILEPLVAGTDLADLPGRLRDDYAAGLCHLRLPFGPSTSPFPRSEPAPLVSRRAAHGRGEVCRRLGLPDPEAPDAERLVVVCPGGWEPRAWPAVHVPGGAGLRFVTVGDLPVTADAPLLALPHALPEGVSFPDLVAAADVVLAKPGYGIASECVAHRTPLVAIEREGFRETPVLLEALRDMGPCATLSVDGFFAGRWEPSLRAALADATPWASVPPDAAARVAGRLAELLEL